MDRGTIMDEDIAAGRDAIETSYGGGAFPPIAEAGAFPPASEARGAIAAWAADHAKEPSGSSLSITRRNLKIFIHQYLKIIWTDPEFDISLLRHSAWPNGSHWSLAGLKYPIELFKNLDAEFHRPDFLTGGYYSRQSESALNFMRIKEICEDFDSEYQILDLSPLDWGDSVVFPILSFRRHTLAGVRTLNSDSETELDLFEIDSFFQALIKALDNHLLSLPFDLNMPLPLDTGRIDFLQAQAAEIFLERATGSTETVEAESLFTHINLVSSMKYERRDNNSYILLAPRHFPHINYNCRFLEPIKINAYRKFRKLLETTSLENLLITDGSLILGAGALSETYDPNQEKAFQINILGHLAWSLSCNGDDLLTCDHGKISERHKVLDRENFLAIFKRTLGMEDKKIWAILRMVENLINEKRGTTLIFSDHAAEETRRLKSESFAVTPFPISAENVAAYSIIDGAVLLDVDCRCHAFGAILDGDSIGDKADSARGSRYNSALRYYAKRRAFGDRLCIIILSDDGMLDIVPILKPQINRSRIDELMIQLMDMTGGTDIDLDKYFECLFELKQAEFCLTQEMRNFIDEGLEKSLEPADGYFRVDPLSRVSLSGLEVLAGEQDSEESFFLTDDYDDEAR